MLTLAGEGVELAVSTDHNHNTDYRPFQQKMCGTDFFTPVIGNEVTTAIGHMNAFPLRAEDKVPDHRLDSWVKLTDDIRSKGARVIILNHPRWPTIPNSPFTTFRLNRVSGDFAPGVRFPFDGMELANALAPQPDPLYLFRDWFALLNHGHRITAIGSSDSHTVSEPVGQGRSFVPSKTDDAAKIDVDDACRQFLGGRTSIGIGIFADVRIDDRFRMGDTNSTKKGNVKVRLRVAAPSWVKPRRALVFLNGELAAEKKVPESRPGRPTDTSVEFSVKRPAEDAYLVCVVLGDGVTHPSWHTESDFTLAATNPVYLDSDGDGQYQAPRDTARRLLGKTGGDLDQQFRAMNGVSEVIAVQMASLIREEAPSERRTQVDERIQTIARGRPLLEQYFREATAAPVKVKAANLH
jgi:hypothetical protein